MSTDLSTHLLRHANPIHELWRRYKKHFRERDFLISVGCSLALFIVSFALNIFAIHFSTTHASNSVADIILSNTPVFEVDGLFVYGTFVVVACVVLLGLAHPKRIPFMLNALALFFVIRSLFVMLTHLAPFETQYANDFGETITTMFFGADQFFSGHTGLPFLGALVFWRELRVRIFFLSASIFFAIIVLLGHIHYSIDVASAFFITYGIFHIAEWLFPKDRALFLSEDRAV